MQPPPQEMASTENGEVESRVIQITNLAPTASKEQMRILFSYIGKISDLRVYPESDSSIPVTTQVAYIKFDKADDVPVAMHLNKTVFVDRALIIASVIDGKIPDESLAMTQATLPSTDMASGLVNPLDAAGVGGMGGFMNSSMSCMDWLGPMGMSNPALMNKSNPAKEIEEAMKRVKEAQNLISAAITEPGDSDKHRRRSRSRSRRRRSRSPRRSKSRRSRSRGRRSHSRGKRSRSRGRKSKSRERTSRSRNGPTEVGAVKSRRSRSRSKGRKRRSRSKSKGRKGRKSRSRSRDRKRKKSKSPRKSRSKSRDRKKRSSKSGSPSQKTEESKRNSTSRSLSPSKAAQEGAESKSPAKKSRSRSRSKSQSKKTKSKSKKSSRSPSKRKSKSPSRRRRSRSPGSRRKSKSPGGRKRRSRSRSPGSRRKRSRSGSPKSRKPKRSPSPHNGTHTVEENSAFKAPVKRDYDEEDKSYEDKDAAPAQENNESPVHEPKPEPVDANTESVGMDLDSD